MLKKYYNLTKPGIIYGNLINTTAGFMLASRYQVDPWLLLATLGGMSLVVASGCVFNNYIDRNIDKKMARTKRRALVIKSISPHRALVFAAILGLAGFLTLSLLTNWLVVAIAMDGFVTYVILYGYAKRHWVRSTEVGSIAGAMPILAGYCAVSGRLDAGALIVFGMLALWQMPHFYAIAMRRHDDYKAARLPVLPVAKGMQAAKTQALLYIVAFIGMSSLLTVYGYTGYIYLATMTLVGLVWLGKGLQDFSRGDPIAWGKKMFLFSLVVILVMFVMLSIGSRLP